MRVNNGFVYFGFVGAVAYNGRMLEIKYPSLDINRTQGTASMAHHDIHI